MVLGTVFLLVLLTTLYIKITHDRKINQRVNFEINCSRLSPGDFSLSADAVVAAHTEPVEEAGLPPLLLLGVEDLVDPRHLCVRSPD